MVTQQEFLRIAKSKINQKVTVDTNPYGGQCISYIDACIREATNGAKNMAYTNAVDGLTKARQLGYEVFTSGVPQPGDVYVISTSKAQQGHTFGHIGICLEAKEDQYLIGLEQNVDGNKDALTNGGWVRQVNNTWGSDGSLYNNYIHYPSGYLIGWFRPWSGATSTTQNTPDKEEVNLMQELIELYAVKELGTVFIANLAAGTIHGLTGEEYKAVKAHHKFRTGKEIYEEQVPTKAKLELYKKAYGLKEV